MSKIGSLVIWLLLFSLAPARAAPQKINNPATPPVIQTWHLREIWHLDSEENETLPLMGVITQAVVDKNGHVLLLDSQMAQVLEISPAGEFLGTLSRMGQGPGELERPNTLFLTSDDKLGLVQVYPGKVVFLNRDNTPAGTFMAQGAVPMFLWVREAAGNLVVRGQTTIMADGQGGRTADRFLARYSRQGERRHVYLRNQTTSHLDPPAMDEKGTWFPNLSWTLAADGSLLMAAGRDEYTIEWLEPDGKIRRIITRTFQPHVRTREERKSTLDRMRMWGPGGELEPRKSILPVEPAIDQIQVLHDGRIWVRSCYAERDLPDGIHCRYDVYDSEGHLESEVRIALPVDRDTDYFSMLADGRFLWFRHAKSALASVFANMEVGDKNNEDPEDKEDMVLQVILLERNMDQSSY